MNTLSNLPAHPKLRRRTVMISALAGATANVADASPQSPSALVTLETRPLAVHMTVNRQAVALDVQARSSLLDVLREQLGLTGAKKGCDHGQCGACTVHVDGRRVASCLTLAVKADDRAVTTIEGIASPDGTLHPMQQAFLDHDALQCGYCTPGQIMAAIACVQEGHAGSDAQIREFMSGNLCRCGAYVGILEAIREAASLMQHRREPSHA